MASDAKPACIGAIGLGYWGPNLVRSFAAAEGASLTALCDLNEDALGAQLARYPEARGTRDLGEIIGAPDIDVMVISTRPSENYCLCKAALEAGQHVFDGVFRYDLLWRALGLNVLYLAFGIVVFMAFFSIGA